MKKDQRVLIIISGPQCDFMTKIMNENIEVVLKMHKNEKDVTLVSYFTNKEFISYLHMLHAHSNATKTFSVLLNSASRKYPRGSVAKLLDVSKICRSVNSGSQNTSPLPPTRPSFLGFIMKVFCGEHCKALR